MTDRSNRVERGASHPEDGDGARVYETGTGKPGTDGYKTMYRRPRTRHTTESVDPKKADRIEKAYRSYGRDYQT